MKNKIYMLLANICISAYSHLPLTFKILLVVSFLTGLEKIYGVTEAEIFNIKDRNAHVAQLIYDYQNLKCAKVPDNKKS